MRHEHRGRGGWHDHTKVALDDSDISFILAPNRWSAGRPSTNVIISGGIVPVTALGCDQTHVQHRPRLLSDNGPSYIADELADYIEARRMSHVRGAPCHPQTQGKIERLHQTLKTRILLENYFLPGDLEAHIDAFVEHYNHQRYHESLNNVTPADTYFGRAQAIVKKRKRIRRQTIEYRRLQHRKFAA